MCDPKKLEEIKASKAKYDDKVAKVLQKMPERRPEFVNTSGIPIQRVYTPLDMADFDYMRNWAYRGNILTPGRCSPPPTGGATGPCASTPASAPPKRPTSAITSC